MQLSPVSLAGQLHTCGAGYGGRLGHGLEHGEKHVKNLKCLETIPDGVRLEVLKV